MFPCPIRAGFITKSHSVMLKQSKSSQLLKQTKEPEVQLHSQDRSVAGRWHRGDTQNC